MADLCRCGNPTAVDEAVRLSEERGDGLWAQIMAGIDAQVITGLAGKDGPGLCRACFEDAEWLNDEDDPAFRAAMEKAENSENVEPWP